MKTFTYDQLLNNYDNAISKIIDGIAANEQGMPSAITSIQYLKMYSQLETTRDVVAGRARIFDDLFGMEDILNMDDSELMDILEQNTADFERFEDAYLECIEAICKFCGLMKTFM